MPSTVHANPEARSAITVRWYNTFGMPLSEMPTAQHTARDILRRAGFETVWRMCRTAHGPSRSLADSCEDRLEASELVVRLVAISREMADASLDSLGFSYVNTEMGAGTLSTIFADRVVALAHGAGVENGVVLGRAIAHEIGHLLMGSTTHSTTGLMRAHWSRVALEHEPMIAWSFSNVEASQMQHGLTARIESTPAPLAAGARSTDPNSAIRVLDGRMPSAR